MPNISSCLRMVRGVLDLELLGKGDEFGRGLGLEVLEFHFPHAGRPGNGVDAVNYGSTREREGRESQVSEGAFGALALACRPDATGGSQSTGPT